MPRKKSSNPKCTVRGCKCEWIMVSKNRHQYCRKHMNEANALYNTYKGINAEAIITFADDKLEQSIILREKYARDYLDYEDKGAHLRYINVLKKVLSNELTERKEMYNKLMTEKFVEFAPVV